MQSRMKHPVYVVPAALSALTALGDAVKATGLSETTIELVNLRASQLNGCAWCLNMHASALRKAGQSDERIDTVAGWRDAPYFTDAERAALALAEAETRLADSPDPVPDAVFAEAARHFDETQLAALILAVAQINLWNRLNVATHHVAGAY
ncbi:carboxymuconolactone decarboxylase family protein [Frankia sp. AgB1.9]|uniref:carboxymuconolactone decarboxylase family protein n=1 Tax=unclassified Frankia TaxID=2632575 RepID=UPI0019323A49|nr:MULTISPECIES: carboxymuconolactone decarboxylase family protein [unclassified Frankia]MBL7492231.1 carboxymuconolactone decarboxylase family protein [Frankia sp. AgW1.1]MBL7553559.1 carboxymuconolactone decarboxylase family protein [Frankia sp. AgB1.9]MBL7623696.1 carboxymuconolactone decarboxylase family protein [Frankia sp. AgB1.8]